MFKVKIMSVCKLAVIHEGETIIRKCFEDEDVFIPEINMTDVNAGLYRPYKNQLIGVSKRSRPAPIPQENKEEVNSALEEIRSIRTEVVSAVGSLKGLIEETKNALKEVKEMKTGSLPVPPPEKPSDVVVNETKRTSNIIIPGNTQDIPEDVFIEEGEEIIKPYTQEAYEKYHAKVRDIIAGVVVQHDDPDDEVAITRMDTVRQKLPIFAEKKIGATREQIEGEIKIALDTKDQANIIEEKGPIVIVKDDKGRIDPFLSLGAHIN